MFQLWASKAAEEKATRLKRSAVTSFVSIKIDTRKGGAGQIDFCQAYVEHILLYIILLLLLQLAINCPTLALKNRLQQQQSGEPHTKNESRQGCSSNAQSLPCATARRMIK